MLTADELVARLKWRYATKAFDPLKKIPEPVWSALEETLVLTPSSYGLQPWKFLIITNQELREQLVPHSWGQRQVADCSHLVVMTVKRKLSVEDIDAHVARVAGVREVAVESLAGFRKMMIRDLIDGPRSHHIHEWAVRQAYIALGSFMTSAAVLGVDACPMEGFMVDKYDELLGLELQGLTTGVVCPAGYRAETDRYALLAKVRFLKEDVVQRID